MAEPLLKRTFSKLRAKERFRRKTDPKLTGERPDTADPHTQPFSFKYAALLLQCRGSFAEDANEMVTKML